MCCSSEPQSLSPSSQQLPGAGCCPETLRAAAPQGANLYERTVKGIARCVVAAPAPAARVAARDALLALLVSLDAWAGPLKASRNPSPEPYVSLPPLLLLHCNAARMEHAARDAEKQLFGCDVFPVLPVLPVLPVAFWLFGVHSEFSCFNCRWAVAFLLPQDFLPVSLDCGWLQWTGKRGRRRTHSLRMICSAGLVRGTVPTKSACVPFLFCYSRMHTRPAGLDGTTCHGYVPTLCSEILPV